MAIRWEPSLSIGIPEIDEQHRELFGCYGKLLAALKTGDPAELERLFESLGDCLMEHFSAEEEWMKSTSYPDFAMHKAAHDGFVKDFLELKGQYEVCGPIPPVITRINGWLVEWLRAHLVGVDRALARHLLKSRQQPPGRS